MTESRRPDNASARLERRDFLKLGIAGGVASVVAACGWDGGNAVRPLLLDVSRVNDWVGENILYSRHRLAPEYDVALRTPRMPMYFISPELPMLKDPGAWRLQVAGLVKRPQAFSLGELQAMPRTTYTVKHHCVEGWSAIETWHGVPVSVIAERCELLPTARYARFDSFDSGYSNGWDLASAMHPQTILAYGMNDNPLPPAHGAPLRLYSPTKLGYKLTKYVVSMTFTAERPGGYWEDQGYPWFAGV